MRDKVIYKIPWKNWKILAGMVGIDELYGITFADAALEERDMLQGIYAMYQAGILLVEEEWKLHPQYERLLEPIREGRSSTIVLKNQEKTWVIYRGDTSTCVAADFCEKDTLDVWEIEEEEIKELLFECFFPSYKCEVHEKHVWTASEEMPCGEVVAECEMIECEEGKKSFRYVLSDGANGQVLYRQSGEYWEKKVYNSREFSEELFVYGKAEI